SYGLVSARGVIPLSLSLDHVGPITRTVPDAAIVLDAIAEAPRNFTASLDEPLGRLVVGIPHKDFFEELDGAVASSMEQAIAGLRRLGFELREVELPVDSDRTLQMAEGYSYHRGLVRSSPELYDPETLRRIRSGESISEAAYRAALTKLDEIR